MARKKRKHHYVWKYYLKQWAHGDKIWCLRDNKIFNTNLVNVAQERDFYKLRDLNSAEIQFANAFIKSLESSPSIFSEINKNWVSLFTVLRKLDRGLAPHEIFSKELHGDIDTMIHNMEEDFHAMIETKLGCYIDKILKEDADFFETGIGYFELCYFLTLQYLRTKKMQQSVSSSTANTQEILQSHKDVNIDNIWPILRHVIAVNITVNLIQRRDFFSLTLLKNQSNKEFLAGDQPVINTYATSKTTVSEKLEYYYPLSPKLAILISEDPQLRNVKEINLDADQVEIYNNQIVRHSLVQIYASTQESLQEYQMES